MGNHAGPSAGVSGKWATAVPLPHRLLKSYKIPGGESMTLLERAPFNRVLESLRVQAWVKDGEHRAYSQTDIALFTSDEQGNRQPARLQGLRGPKEARTIRAGDDETMRQVLVPSGHQLILQSMPSPGRVRDCVFKLLANHEAQAPLPVNNA